MLTVAPFNKTELLSWHANKSIPAFTLGFAFKVNCIESVAELHPFVVVATKLKVITLIPVGVL